MLTRNVLIVEDENDLSMVFVSILETLGFRGTIAENAERAKSLLQKNKYDILIIDLTLPDIEGVELYKQIISTKPHYKGSVIFTSGAAAYDKLDQLIQKDGNTFLSKPFSINQFKKILNRWI
jgi:DNA-binding NtrC family response regulator